MSENTYKKHRKPKKRNISRRKRKASNSSVSFFRILDKAIRVEPILKQGVSVSYLPYLFFLTFLGIIYIGNSHYAEQMIRQVSRLESKVDNLKADYTTLKVDYMYFSKQTEIAEKAKNLDLEESNGKIQKIIIKENEY